MSNILVSGAQSGIGKYICEQLNGIPLTRENIQILNKNDFDIIIHCANNRNKFPYSSELFQYYLDNLRLTEKLVSCNHKKFIYFSTCEVYPYQSGKIWREKDEIPVSDLKGVYPYLKLMSEKIVENESEQNLILRLSSLLGKYTKPNTITRIFNKKKGPFSLSEQSVFNFVSYEDVLGLVNKSITSSISGTFNVVSSNNIDLKKIAILAKNEPIFGKYVYKIGNISNEKITQYKDSFKKTSEEILISFFKEVR